MTELRKQIAPSNNDDMIDDMMNQLEIVVKQCRDRMRRLFEGTLEDNVVPSNNNSSIRSGGGRGNNSTLRVDNL
jgi:hypothetical protein